MNASHRTLASDVTRAFVLKEMLIVLSVAGLLLVVQLPSLGHSRQSSSAATCRNNLRQLIQAWQTYSQDNGGKIAPAGNGGSSSGKTSGNECWMGGWLDYTDSFDNVNTDLLLGSESNPYAGHLGAYLKNDATVFRCPSDSSQVSLFGRAYGRDRSYSINNWMGGSVYCGQNFRVFKNQSDISGLAPSRAWVVLDEREDSINDAWFAVDMADNLVNFPASYHGGGGNLSFADGHVEYHHWQDPRTNPELIKDYLLPLNQPSPDNADLDWLRARTTVAR